MGLTREREGGGTGSTTRALADVRASFTLTYHCNFGFSAARVKEAYETSQTEM